MHNLRYGPRNMYHPLVSFLDQSATSFLAQDVNDDHKARKLISSTMVSYPVSNTSPRFDQVIAKDV
jgi:hypothetical protein